MCNKILREYAKDRSVKLWQIGDKLGMSDANFSRMLRHELSAEKQKKIFAIIDEISLGQEAANDR